MKTSTRLSLVFILAPQLASAQSSLGWLHADPVEVPSAGPGASVFFSNDFKQVPNPLYKDPNKGLPPHLTDAHVEKLIKKMVEAELATMPPRTNAKKVTLKEEDLMRLVSNLVIIDANYVDDIPAAVWDKAVDDLGAVAAAEFPKTKNWEETITAMVKAAAGNMLDPFSVYWSKDEYKRFNDGMKNSFVGIGVILREDGSIDIVIPGGPAEKAGLLSGDKIVAVDGTPVKGSEAVVKKTLGKAGTPVVMTVERGGQARPPVGTK